MNPDEVKAALVILTILILGSGWLLALKVRSHFRTRARLAQREAERELGSSRSRDPQPNEIWKWPSRSHGVPGVWGGPTEVLEDFLWRLQHTGRHEILRNASIKINGIDLTKRVKRVRIIR